jgi:hypothetical protein
MLRKKFYIFIGFFISLSIQTSYASGPPWGFILSEGETEARIGFLVQPRFESIGNTAENARANDLYLRRFRLLAGGKIASKLSFFVESGGPNLWKKDADGKRSTDFFLQDAYLSYAFRPEFQLDGGMLITPVSRNSAHSAASLLPIDYGPFSFLASAPTRSKFGRDYGMQARGYLKRHFEYRFGVYRGNTDHDGAFPYRYLARVVWYPFDADTGFFYTGPTFGGRKVVGIGASLDRQGDYSANSVDVFMDLPVGGGDALTAHANFIRYDGGSAFESLPKQNTWLMEASYYFNKVRISPYLQIASRNYTDLDSPDDMKVEAGAAFWILGHRFNIKTGMGRSLKDGESALTQFLIQGQLFYF